jgi:hypothetical protein
VRQKPERTSHSKAAATLVETRVGKSMGVRAVAAPCAVAAAMTGLFRMGTMLTRRVIFGVSTAQPTQKTWMHVLFLPSAGAIAPGGA